MQVEFVGGALDGEVRDINSPPLNVNMSKFSMKYYDFEYNPNAKLCRVRERQSVTAQGVYQYRFDGRGKYHFQGLAESLATA